MKYPYPTIYKNYRMIIKHWREPAVRGYFKRNTVWLWESIKRDLGKGGGNQWGSS